MARTTVTEESLGLAPSEEEMAVVTAADIEDDVPVEDEPAEQPSPAGKQAKETEQPAKADTEAGKEPEKPTDEAKTVDLRALQEARAEAREAKRNAAILEQRMNALLAAQQQAKAPEKAEPERPDPSDPMAILNYLVKEVEEGRLSREAAQEEARKAGEAQVFQRNVQALEQKFAETTPDYWDAFKHVAASRDAELAHLYPHTTAAEREAYMREELRAFTQSHLNLGNNPAEAMYALAQMRGYQKPQPNVAAANDAKRMDMAAIAEAQKRHQSLSDAPGGEAPPALDAKALARMSDKEFKQWMSQRGNEEKFDQIMGKG